MVNVCDSISDIDRMKWIFHLDDYNTVESILLEENICKVAWINNAPFAPDKSSMFARNTAGNSGAS